MIKLLLASILMLLTITNAYASITHIGVVKTYEGKYSGYLYEKQTDTQTIIRDCGSLSYDYYIALKTTSLYDNKQDVEIELKQHKHPRIDLSHVRDKRKDKLTCVCIKNYNIEQANHCTIKGEQQGCFLDNYTLEAVQALVDKVNSNLQYGEYELDIHEYCMIVMRKNNKYCDNFIKGGIK